MNNSCSPPLDQCPSHCQAAISCSWPAPLSLYSQHGTSPWPVWGSCPGCAASLFIVQSCRGRARTRTSGAQSKHCPAAAKHHCVTNIILKLHPKHSTGPAAENRMNSMPAETRTLRQANRRLTVCFSSQCKLGTCQ